MKDAIFSNKDLIHEGVRNIVDELHSLLKENDVESLLVVVPSVKTGPLVDYDDFHMFYTKKLCMDITTKEICLRDNRNREGHWLKIANENGKFTATDDEFLPFLYIFIKQYYDKYQTKVIEGLHELKYEEKTISDEINFYLQRGIEIRKKKEAIVEINMPNNIGLQKIEVVEEDGKKIGTINFGDQIIKIYTEGEIVLCNKNEEAKDKEKKKVKKNEV